MKRFIFIFVCFFTLGLVDVAAQRYDPVAWNYSVEKIKKDLYILTFKTVIPPEWMIYSMNTPQGGPVALSIEFGQGAKIIGNAIAPEPLKKYEELLSVEVWYYSGTCVISQTVKIKPSVKNVRGTLKYQVRKEGVNAILEKDFDIEFDADHRPVISEVRQWVKREGKVYVNGEYVKYSEFLHAYDKIHGFFDYNQALRYAQAWNKPLFVVFTGHGCMGCREAEFEVYHNAEVIEILNKEYVCVFLYVDDKTRLPEEECYISARDGKMKNTLAKMNTDFQIGKFRVNAQPNYILLDSWGGNEEDLLSYLLTPMQGYTSNKNLMMCFLRDGVKAFKDKQAKRESL